MTKLSKALYIRVDEKFAISLDAFVDSYNQRRGTPGRRLSKSEVVRIVLYQAIEESLREKVV